MNRRTAIALACICLSLLACVGSTPQKPNQGVTPKDVKPEPKEKAAPAFLSVTQAARVGNVQVQILSGSIGKIRVKSFRVESETKDEFFQLRIRITNLSETKILNYDPWAGVDGIRFDESASVKDEHDNRYFRFTSSLGDSPAGFVGRTVRVDPGKSVDDIFAFERPVDRAKTFIITLPGHNIEVPESNITYKVERKFFQSE